MDRSRDFHHRQIIFESFLTEGAFCLFKSKIDDLQPLFSGIVDGIGCAAAVPCQVTDTYAAIIYQVSVAPIHTVRCVLLGCVDNLICLGFDALILRHILWPPSLCLRQTW